MIPQVKEKFFTMETKKDQLCIKEDINFIKINTQYKMKIDLPSFDERLDVEEFLDWASKVENFFKYADMSDEKKIKLVAFKFQRGASSWWEQVETNPRYYGKPPIRSWPKLLKMMKKRFLPLNY